MGIDLSNYVEVNDRIAAFYEKHPEGSLQSIWETVEVGGNTFIVCDAFAYRTPDDERPGQGTAWECFPGKTPYTKDSELMNAQTSAWGRAIAALGFEVRRGIATREDVQNRSGGNGSNAGGSQTKGLATEKQRKWVLGDGEKPGLVQKADFSPEQLDLLAKWSQNDAGKLTFEAASFLIENLKDGTAEGRTAVLERIGWSDVPGDLPAVDTSDFEPDGKTAPKDETEVPA